MGNAFKKNETDVNKLLNSILEHNQQNVNKIDNLKEIFISLSESVNTNHNDITDKVQRLFHGILLKSNIKTNELKSIVLGESDPSVIREKIKNITETE